MLKERNYRQVSEQKDSTLFCILFPPRILCGFGLFTFDFCPKHNETSGQGRKMEALRLNRVGIKLHEEWPLLTEEQLISILNVI